MAALPDDLRKSFQYGQKLIQRAQKLMSQHQWDKALSYLQEAQKVFVETESPLAEAQVYFLMGVIAEQQNRFHDALQSYTRCFELRSKIGTTMIKAETALKMAQMEMHLSAFEEAHDHAQKAIELLEHEPDPVLRLDAFFTNGTIFFLEGNLESAEFYYSLAEDARLDIPSTIRPQNILNFQENFATIKQILGKFTESNDIFQKVLAEEYRLKNYFPVASILEQMAVNYKEMENKEAALGCIEDAYQIRKTHLNPQIFAAYIRNHLLHAEIAAQFHDLEKAKEKTEASIIIAEEHHLLIQLCESLLKMGKWFIESARHIPDHVSLSQKYLDEALSLAKSTQNVDLLLQYYILMIQLSRIISPDTDYNNLLTEIENLLPMVGLNSLLYHKIQGFLHRYRGFQYYSTQEWDLAQKAFQQALHHFTQGHCYSERAESHYNIACTSAIVGIPESVITHLQQAILLNKKYKTIALHDADLKGIWKEKFFQDHTKED